MQLALALLAGLFAPSALAWSTDVHNQIGFMAEKLVNPRTARTLGAFLEPEYEGSIGRAAAWADGPGRQAPYAFSSQWHYIDPADNPPHFCNVHYNRDCTRGGCVISALANQTVILADCVARRPREYNVSCANAYKWVAHFVGDLHQPLHNTGLAAGGNGFPVTFGGKTTNLHSIWDGTIIRQLTNATTFGNTSLAAWPASLIAKLRQDAFFQPTASWLATLDLSTPLDTALAWSRETNLWNCDYVFSQIFNGTDLATSGYAVGAYPIVEVQVAKAAFRLAAWLDGIVEGRYKKRDVVFWQVPSYVGGPNGGV